VRSWLRFTCVAVISGSRAAASSSSLATTPWPRMPEFTNKTLSMVRATDPSQRPFLAHEMHPPKMQPRSREDTKHARRMYSRASSWFRVFVAKNVAAMKDAEVRVLGNRLSLLRRAPGLEQYFFAAFAALCVPRQRNQPRDFRPITRRLSEHARGIRRASLAG